MFAVFCKIYALRKAGFTKPIQLRHYSKYPQFEKVCRELTSLLSDVHIESFSKTVSEKDTIDQVLEAVKNGVPHLNGKYNGLSPIPELNDPDYIALEPYPVCDLPLVESKLAPEMFHVGVQLHSGKMGGNYKGFSLPWLKKVASGSFPDLVQIHLFGTGDGYSARAIDSVCQLSGMRNHVGQTSFFEWLSLIRSMDFFFSPEGFAPFFAMSQRVKTVYFYRNATIISRVHPLWRINSFAMNTGETSFVRRALNRISYLYLQRRMLIRPLPVTAATSLLHGEFFGRKKNEKYTTNMKD